MANRPAVVVLFLYLWACLVSGETVQDDWTYPQKPDDSSTLTSGQTTDLTWTSALQDWFSLYCEKCDTSKVDLWVTDEGSNYQHKIASNVDVTSTFSYEWGVTLPDSELTNSPTWVLRFVPSGAGLGNGEISSPVFVINKGSTTTTTTSAESPETSTTETTEASPTTEATDAAATTASTSATTAAGVVTTITAANGATSTITAKGATSTTGADGATATSPAGTATATPSAASITGLSSGAKAGVGVGAGLVVVLLLAAGALLWRRRSRKSRSQHGMNTPVMNQHNHDPSPAYSSTLGSSKPGSPHNNYVSVQQYGAAAEPSGPTELHAVSQQGVNSPMADARKYNNHAPAYSSPVSDTASPHPSYGHFQQNGAHHGGPNELDATGGRAELS